MFRLLAACSTELTKELARPGQAIFFVYSQRRTDNPQPEADGQFTFCASLCEIPHASVILKFPLHEENGRAYTYGDWKSRSIASSFPVAIGVCSLLTKSVFGIFPEKSGILNGDSIRQWTTEAAPFHGRSACSTSECG